jgi:hypothetical protein
MLHGVLEHRSRGQHSAVQGTARGIEMWSWSDARLGRRMHAFPPDAELSSRGARIGLLKVLTPAFLPF